MLDDTPVYWRGAMAGQGRAEHNQTAADQIGKVLLLVGLTGNRRRLAEHLGTGHEIIVADREVFPAEPFDLAIVDSVGIVRWHHELAQARAREQPAFLPSMLIVPRADIVRELSSYWYTLDEFLVTPIDRSELTQRVSMLLRARRLAVAQQSRLAHLVHYDRTTGLPNKQLFLDRLSQAVHDASVLNQKVYAAALHIPLSGVLRSLGARRLESAAKVCSNRLRTLLREDLSIARLGPETWGFIVRTGRAVEDFLEVCAGLRRLEETPIEVEGERFHIAPRIAVATYPDDASSAAILFDHATATLSQVEQSRVPTFYSRAVQTRALKYIRTEARLHEALDRQEFELWLQPKVKLSDRKPIGVEALVRWRLPSQELVPPGDFIAVAESCGLIKQIDRWMMDRACAVLRSLRDAGTGISRIAVNVSAQDISDPEFVEFVKSTLSRYEVPPAALEIEMTETALVDASEENLSKLQQLRAHGVRLALDDFGTGYCSLSYLHNFPITTLKIDRCFVADIEQNAANATIARCIVGLAQGFDLEIVAEGIETESQADYLSALDVQVGQGFLFARPMHESDLLQWLCEV